MADCGGDRWKVGGVYCKVSRRCPVTNSQLCYIISCLIGDAAETVYLFRPNTVKEVVIILEAFYGDLN